MVATPPCLPSGGGNPLEPFNENAAQVKRLVQRDRKDFLGNEVDILDKYEKEFGSFEDPAADSSTPSTSSSSNGSSSAAPVASTSAAAPAASPPPAAAAKPASPFASSVASSFTASKPAVSSPFGPSTTPYKKSVVEPKGLSPDMSPDPIRAPAAAPGNFLSRITLTQVVSGGGGWVEKVLSGMDSTVSWAHACPGGSSVLGTTGLGPMHAGGEPLAPVPAHGVD